MHIVSGRTPIKLTGVNPYIVVDTAEAAAICAGWRRPLPVCYRLNGDRNVWRINLMPKGDGAFYLYLDGKVRRATDAKVGDMVYYEIWFDTEYQGGPQHKLPAELIAAFRASPIAKARYDSLTPSLQKEIVRYFASPKTGAAISRNVEKCTAVLSGAHTRWLGRDWNC
jgi:hypothetical protein